MKHYEVFFNPEESAGVYGISLVESPATKHTALALSEQKTIQLTEIDKEKRILLGLVLEPNVPIYRNENGNEFTIQFSEATIEALAYNFFENNYQKNSTIEHAGKKIEGVTFTESWLVENTEKDKTTNYGLCYPRGSWVAVMKIHNDEIWNDYVKSGKVKGFSIDAMVELKEITQNNLNMNENEKSLLEKIAEGIGKITLTMFPEKVALGSAKTSEGIVIEFEGDAMQVGGAISAVSEDGTKLPVPIGEYLLEDGSTLVVSSEGIIGEIKPAGESAPAQQQMAGENVEKQAESVVNAIKSMLVKFESQTKKEFDSLKVENENLKKEVLKLAEQPAAKPIKTVLTQVNYSEMSNLEKVKFNRGQL